MVQIADLCSYALRRFCENKETDLSGGCCHASTYLEVKLPLSVFGILPDFLACAKSAMHTIEENGFRRRLLFRRCVCGISSKIYRHPDTANSAIFVHTSPMAGIDEHTALTMLVHWVDSPTTATCWRRRPMPRHRRDEPLAARSPAIAAPFLALFLT